MLPSPIVFSFPRILNSSRVENCLDYTEERPVAQGAQTRIIVLVLV